ncbi:glycosyltransferase family 2 protein [Candidatus Tisiphia endosymbiont of Beris chalybata]|uniref:glycosyltransferase family 2 protein n=1 Tax=Candidatus Tisiphia endosymbiont of Beris chalybata TaxID=3066262 RepID=UPI00312CAFB1
MNINKNWLKVIEKLVDLLFRQHRAGNLHSEFRGGSSRKPECTAACEEDPSVNSLLKASCGRKIITNLQMSLIKLQYIAANRDNYFLSVIIEVGMIDNEQLINILHNNKILPLLRSAQTNIKIYDYCKVNQYVKFGYFIYQDDNDDTILAINDVTYLKQLAIIYNNTNIQLIKKEDFYQILEQNFSHLNIIRAKYLLEFITGSIVTKNINYTKEILTLLLIYFGIFLNFQHFFHILNVICYFSQNTLKLILFKRAIIGQEKHIKKKSSQAGKMQCHTSSMQTCQIDSLKSSTRPAPTILLCYDFAARHDGAKPIDNRQALSNDACKFISEGYRSAYAESLLDKSYVLNCYPQHLPIYTILLPLYKESNKLKSLINYIINLDYPKSKLDVKIIVEADDLSMTQESILYTLPSYMHLIKVPFSLPRTKPKALNYAMQYCKGKYVVIYDAEDRPASDQLLKAVMEFDRLPEEYVCLQAKLTFYNENENLLTKFFSIEYCIWFEYLLTGLSLMNLPVLLGGTSNHFKLDILQKVGFWDAYNVTEDADLGIRLSSFNYKVWILDSYTYEESPIDILSWINQRSRWIKGFLQTFLVFIAQEDKYRKFHLTDILVILILVGFSSYSFCCLPFLIIMIKINNVSIIHYLWWINTFFAFSYLYGSAFFILWIKKSKVNNFKTLDIIALFLWPFYFLLHTIAGYKAIWEIIFIPFKWNKTKHGVSRQQLD